ncbi:MAG: EF-hand domain-containing protein [Gloeobacteraceae cyanobacterium ES-bin-144]|nr:EF-hand domain-containing protein [Verrucomicrobiales bacterium]
MKSVLCFLAIILCACEPSGIGPVVPSTPVQRQMIGFLQKFDRWDDNGDGYLEPSEITAGINSLRGKPQQVTYTTAEVMDFYDTNKDGKISITEAQEGYKHSAAAESKLKH